MNRRIVLLIIAVLVAALGTTAIFIYVRGINNRAVANQQPVSILVATKMVPLGTLVSAANSSGTFALRSFPRDIVPAGALSSITAITNEVALTAIFPGQQIVSAEFGQQGMASALPIPAKSIAISVQLGDPNRVAGFVQPGSYVAIFDTLTAAAGGAGTPATKAQTRLLLPRAEVIAVGPQTITSTTTTNTRTGQVNTEQIPLAILTLALSQGDAEKVIFAQQGGSLYLGLLTNQSSVTPDAGVNVANLFG